MCNYNDESYVDGAIAASYPANLFEDQLESTPGFYFSSPINYIKNIDSIEKIYELYFNCGLS